MDYQQNENEIRARRQRRIAQMKREKERRLRQQAMIKRFFPLVTGCAVVLVVLGIGIGTAVRAARSPAEENDAKQPGIENGSAQQNDTEGQIGGAGNLEGSEPPVDNQNLPSGEQTTDGKAPENTDGIVPAQAGHASTVPYSASANADTRAVSSEVVSSNAVFIDLSTDTILAQRDAHTRINPASMTKILTILTAAEHVTDLDDTFTITIDITDYSYVNDCSCVGFEVGETVTVRDLFYGTILPSGADAALGLAVYVAGSQEAFAELMNEKLEELGLSDTAHFTNCVGIYDSEHYCTVYDMAMILKAALDNEFCKQVLSAHTYTTSSTEQHPEGITISNWFLRRIEDKDTYGEVLCGKTGYVLQSGNCAASYGLDTQGGSYICVTTNSTSSWRCIYDHVALYQQFLPPPAVTE